MVTADQVKTYLASQGIDNVPDFIIDAWVLSANSIQECLDEHYDAGTALLIQMYLIGLFGVSNMDKYISSQTAPSGASRSFRYNNFADRWNGQWSLLRGLDKYGCTAAIVPPNPNAKNAALFVADGGCCGG